MAQEKKAAPDWERIEADYRVGVLSIREIAAVQGLTDTAIRKRAKRDGWVRDLAAKVQAKASALVRAAEVRSEVRAASAISERELIDDAAQTVAGVQLSQRKDIARSRTLAMSLLGELEAHTGSSDLFDQLGDLLRKDDEKGQDKRNDIYRKVISSAGRIDSMKKLSDTLKTLVGLEREAYGFESAQAPTINQQTVNNYSRDDFIQKVREANEEV